MSTSRTGATNGRDQGVPPEGRREGTVGTFEHCACGLAGLVATAVCVVLLYPALVSATRPRHLLSSVALVFIVVTAWVLVWLSFEVVWEWRAGRLTTQ